MFSIVALLSCAMPYKATGAGSAGGGGRAVCNVEDKTTRADKMPMLINYAFPAGSGKSDHR
ncbi:hypothetical protein BZK35_17310 [Escherichia coli]|nr:hypothetical protein BZK35_17310 [Escherichia coli]